MGITILPSLDDVSREPEKLEGLDLVALAALLLRANAVAGSIAARLVLNAANGAAPAPANDDRMLTPAEAAALLRKKTRWLYRHADHLPFIRRIGPRSLLCSEHGIRDYLAHNRT